MNTKPYELAGDIPKILHGKFIETRLSTSLDEMHLLVADGKPELVRFLAQAQYDVLAQRQVRNFLASEYVAAVLAGGETGVDSEGKTIEGETPVDWSGTTEDDRVAHVMTEAAKIGVTWAYSGRAAGTGKAAEVAVAKAKASKLDAIVARAAEDPALAKKLAALGIL